MAQPTTQPITQITVGSYAFNSPQRLTRGRDRESTSPRAVERPAPMRHCEAACCAASDLKSERGRGAD